MKDCTPYAPMIGAREGELTGEESALLAAHLEGCEACQARLADERALEGLLGEALLRQAARRDFTDFADEVMARIGQAEGRSSFAALRAFFRRHRLVAAASALAPAVAALGLIVYLERRAGGPEPGEVEVVSEMHAPMVLDAADGPLILLGDDDEEGT
jgi:anti-sigma factor RsiW